MPHAPATHVAVPFVGAEHALQLAPQWVASASSKHIAPQAWVPLAHVVTSPQPDPSHVAIWLALPAGHAVHDVPQCIGDVFETQAPPQQ